MGELIDLKPNCRTHKRRKAQREATKKRLIARIGIRHEDAPLFDEQLAFLAYQESLKHGR